MLPSRPLVAFWVYLLYVSTLTLSPFQFSWASEWGASFFSLQHVGGVDIFLNIVGFSVFGIILYWLRPGMERALLKLCVALCCAGMLSTIIECLQVYVPERHAQAMDVVTNMVGGGIGFLSASYVHHNSWHLRLARLKNTLAIISIFIYVTGAFIVFMVTAMPQSLDSWDPSFPLLIGNEASLDRPWLGNISSLIIFDHAVDQNQITSIFTTGHRPYPDVQGENKPIVAYRFNEGAGTAVNDQSQFEEPVNMNIRSLDKTAWLPGGGLRIKEPTLLQSGSSGEKIHRRIKDTDAFSVSMRFESASLDQYGPARIVSFSENTLSRNFTIGQQGAKIHFRVRDRVSGNNGTRWALEVPYVLRLMPEATHWVFVYEKGIKRVYIDGEKVCEEYPPDWLAFIAWFLHFDSDLPWQRWMLGSLLVGGLGICFWPLAIQRKCEKTN
jgi:glycopeptide antibiotics resistance protein